MTELRRLFVSISSRTDVPNLWAMSVIKSIRLHEKVNFEVRAEAKNALNHPNYGGPNLTPTNALFGTISGALGSRQITVQGKLNW